MKKFSIIIFFLLSVKFSYSQNTCTTLGQTPATAFPVCGTDTFYQSTVPACFNGYLTVPGCSASSCQGGYGGLNPFWYKFTCYSAGTLGFIIIPNKLTDDYDWQLFDITGHDPNDIFSQNLVVTGNWCGTTGNTGASANGVPYIQCCSDPTQNLNSFSTMPTLQQGHTYLLMVSHYTSTNQSGYKLIFSGGTAGITDPDIPGYSNASGICGGDKIGLKLTKKILCSTIASNGSDFSLTPANVSITGASGYECSTSFDTDSIIIQLNGYISPATYQLIQQVGTDTNTLLDNCKNAVPIGTSAGFTIISQQLLKANFTDTIHYGCVIDTIHFAMDTAHVITWKWIFDSEVINTTQTNPLLYYNIYGSKTAKLIVYNTVCSDSAAITYTLNNSPSKANFNISSVFACPLDSIYFYNTSTGNIVTWYWDFGNGQTSTDKNPSYQIYFTNNNQLTSYSIKLITTDSTGCSDSLYQTLTAVPNCYIAVPSAFTPNGDGLNDYLYPLNAYKATNLTFKIFNRFGQMVFETHDWTIKWDGTINGIKQPSGTYIWFLDYMDSDTNKRIFLKGTTVLIR